MSASRRTNRPGRILLASLSAVALVAGCTPSSAPDEDAPEQDAPDGEEVADEDPEAVAAELAAFSEQVCDAIETVYEPLFADWAELESGFAAQLEEHGLDPEGPPAEASDEEVDAYFAAYSEVGELFDEQAAAITARAATELPPQLRDIDDPASHPGAAEALARGVELDAIASGLDLDGVEPLTDDETDVLGAPTTSFQRIGDAALADALNAADACRRLSTEQLGGDPIFSAGGLRLDDEGPLDDFEAEDIADDAS